MIKALLANSLSNVTVLFVRLIVSFVMAPLIVRSLGDYDYGIWEIVLAIIGYMGILDIGLQPAVTKYVAQYNAVQDRRQLDSIYASSLLLMAFAGLVCLLLFSAIAFIAPNIMEQGTENASRYALFFFILGLQVLITFPGYVFLSFHHGFQRYHVCNLVSILTILAGNTVLFILLRQGGGLLCLATVTASIAYVRYATYWLLLRYPRFGRFRLLLRRFSWATLRELTTFGFKILMGGFAVMISSHMDSVIIGSLLGPTMVTFYAIPRNLVNMAFNVVPAITQSFMPFFSELASRNQTDKTQQAFQVASRYILTILFLFTIELYFLGVPFLAIWIGPEYAEKGRFVLYFLLFSKLCVISPLQARYLTAIGRQMVFVRFAWIMTPLNICLSLIFLMPWGINGVALGTMITYALVYPLIFRTTCRHINIPVGKYLKTAVVPQIIPASALAATLYVLSFTIQLTTYSAIFVTAILSSLLYLLIFFVFSIPSAERQFLMTRIQALNAPRT